MVETEYHAQTMICYTNRGTSIVIHLSQHTWWVKLTKLSLKMGMIYTEYTIDHRLYRQSNKPLLRYTGEKRPSTPYVIHTARQSNVVRCTRRMQNAGFTLSKQMYICIHFDKTVQRGQSCFNTIWFLSALLQYPPSFNSIQLKGGDWIWLAFAFVY